MENWTRAWGGDIGEVVWMSPDECLGNMPHPQDQDRKANTAAERWFNAQSIRDHTEAIENGEPREMPNLDFGSMWFGNPSHEGRHLAFTCKKLGIESIPVHIRR